MSDLYSSNVANIHGNMRNEAISSYNRNVINANNSLATTIQGLKQQQKENEYLSSAKNLVSSVYSGGAYSTKLADHTAFVKAGGSTTGLPEIADAFRKNPSDMLEKMGNKALERANPEGVAEAVRSTVSSPLDEHIASNTRELNPSSVEAEGRVGVSEAEHTEQMGSSLGREGVSALEGGSELASTGKWVGRVGKGLGIAGGIATGGMAIVEDMKPGHWDKMNTAEKVANVGQIIGAGLDVVGTIAPPIALVGGVVDILSGIIGGAGNIEAGDDEEKAYDKEEQDNKQATIETGVVGGGQITTGRTM